MYYFIYDSLAQSPEHVKELARIENRLLDFGIKDKIVKISPLKSVRDAIAESYKHKFNTVVTVGGDDLFLSAISYLIGYPIALGTIPLGKNILISTILGVPYGQAACDVISARKLRETTIGRVDNRFFFSSCVLQGVESIRVDSTFEISVNERSVVVVINHRSTLNEYTNVSKKYGFLTIVVKKLKSGIFAHHKEKESFFFGKTLQIKQRKGFSAAIDNIQTTEHCSTISIYPNAIKCIVGKTSSLG